MDINKVRWGVLSTADIAQTQVIPAIMRSCNAEMVGIASRSGQEKTVASKLSIPHIYNSYEELLRDERIEAVYIPLPNHLHKQWVIEAANYGKHVLVEKPAAITAEEMQEMIEFCRNKNVKLMEAFMYQFHPQHDRVKEIILSNEIGQLKFMRASFSYFLEDRKSNIRMKKEMGGGSIYDIGCYCIHAIRNILQSEPVMIKAFADIDPQSGVDLSSVVHMKLKNGVQCVFDCSFDMAFRQEYEIVGTNGRIIVDSAYRPDVVGNKGVITIQSAQEGRSEEIAGDQYRLQIEHFSQAILEDDQPVYSVENTLKNIRVIDACYQSIATNLAVEI